MKWAAYLFFVLAAVKIGGTLYYFMQGEAGFTWGHLLTKVFWGLMFLGMGAYMLKHEAPEKEDPASLGRGPR